MFDFAATWFSKFVAPEGIILDEVDILQFKCNRDAFLQGFNIIDVSQLDIIHLSQKIFIDDNYLIRIPSWSFWSTVKTTIQEGLKL